MVPLNAFRKSRLIPVPGFSFTFLTSYSSLHHTSALMLDIYLQIHKTLSYDPQERCKIENVPHPNAESAKGLN